MKKARREILKIGDFYEEQIEAVKLGRVAAQIAKQVIIQKVGEAERTKTVSDYEDRIGEMINVTVRRVDRGNIYVDLGSAEGMIKRENSIANELVHKGDHLKACVEEVKMMPRGVQVQFSRITNEMMAKLFTIEVPEIAEGIIEIMGVARDPGLRAKLAIRTKDRRIDPIGSCIGMRGSRVQAVSNELNGEHIDVILYHADPAQFVINAIAPATTVSIVVDEEKKSDGPCYRG